MSLRVDALPSEPSQPASVASDDEGISGYNAEQLATALGLGASIEEVPPVKADRLGEVLVDVWRTHPRVVAAKARIKAAGYEIARARTGYFPSLSINSAQGTGGASTTTLRIVQPLWRGGLTGAKIAEAEAKRQLALAKLNLARLELGLKTAKLYFNVAAAKEKAQRWEQYIKSLEELLGIIKHRAELGVSPPVDVETALARLRAARAGARATAAQLAANRAQLAGLLKRSPGTVVWPRAETKLTPLEIDSVLVNGVVPLHPKRQRALAKLNAAQARVEQAQASLWPTISLQHVRQLEQASGDFTPTHSTQIVLQYKTEGSLQGYRNYQAQTQRVQAARRKLRAVQLEIANRIRTARVQRRAAAAQYEAQASSALSFVRLVESFLRQFKVGRKSWVQVLNAVREAHNALLRTVNIKRRFWLANARLALQGMLWKQIASDVPSMYGETREEE